MKTAREHYDDLLGPVYSWMLGDLQPVRDAQRKIFETLSLEPAATGWAVDLGCGNGAQSLALADLGFQVLAVDGCDAVLQQLSSQAGDLPIETACDDIRNFRAHLDIPADLMTCMGDTLLHLESHAAVEQLLVEMGDGLSALGIVVVAFRDLASAAPGSREIHLVRADDERILTCILDHEEQTTVVTDLLHTRDGDGWQLQSGAYRKLRIGADWMRAALERAQLHLLAEQGADGVLTFAARR